MQEKRPCLRACSGICCGQGRGALHPARGGVLAWAAETEETHWRKGAAERQPGAFARSRRGDKANIAAAEGEAAERIGAETEMRQGSV